jgi:pimeloyl-ACP methyl ester carboxylesterase
MQPQLKRLLVAGVILVPAAILGASACQVLPSMGANGLLHPARRRLSPDQRAFAPVVTFQGDTISMKGWHFPAQGTRRGTLVYLHGVADKRGSSLGVAQRFTPRGFDVIAYDSRAHGDSDGEVCTHGYYEKRDLQRVLDVAGDGPTVVVGSSLGAAVALQTAAIDRRISAVVAAESFSDLRTVARERAPRYFSQGNIRRALAMAESSGRFVVDEVSPVKAAARIAVPVLLVHGGADRETPPEHSHRIFDALRSPRRLLIVAGAGHNQSLPLAWPDIERWIDDVLEAR